MGLDRDGRPSLARDRGGTDPGLLRLGVAMERPMGNPPFNIRPGEAYTDAAGMWELTDHGQWVRMCEDCGKLPADPPSRLCPGCEAYREHTGQI